MINYKYSEDQTIDQIKQYVDSTYKQHYVGINDIQTLDIWESLGHPIPMCQGNAIKYLMRYGKKDGYNSKDLLKAIHYCILLWHYSQIASTVEPTSSNEVASSNVQLLVEKKAIDSTSPHASPSGFDPVAAAEAKKNVNNLLNQLEHLTSNSTNDDTHK